MIKQLDIWKHKTMASPEHHKVISYFWKNIYNASLLCISLVYLVKLLGIELAALLMIIIIILQK